VALGGEGESDAETVSVQEPVYTKETETVSVQEPVYTKEGENSAGYLPYVYAW
jgi:hypothetical protein